MELLKILQILGISISVATFIVWMIYSDKKKILIAIAALVSFLLLGGVWAYDYHHHQKRLEGVSGRVVKKLEGKRMTYDQLCEAFLVEDAQFVGEALGELVRIGKVEHDIRNMTDDLNRTHRVRTYCLK